jgi:hypothetical protein
MSDGDPAPPAAGHVNTAVPLEWVERSVKAPAPGDEEQVDPVALSETETRPDALVVIRGPGGFPLLGAGAIGRRPRALVANPGSPAAPPELLTMTGLAAGNLASGQDVAEAEAGPLSDASAYTWRGSPIPGYSGLGLVSVVTLNAVLSEPIAGFDYLASRLDAGGIRPHPTRKDVGRSRSPGSRD